MLQLAVAWIVYCVVLTMVEFGVLCLLLGTPDSRATVVVVAFLLLNLSQCATVLGSFLLLRLAGVRFVRLPSAKEPSFANPGRE
jgi:hypothetical protein